MSVILQLVYHVRVVVVVGSGENPEEKLRIGTLFYHLPNNMYQPTCCVHSTSFPIPTIMPTKRRRKRLKSARAASLEVFKKRRSEASPLPNPAQLRVDDHKLSTADTTDTEGESGTWFWNESANETDSDTEEEGNGNHEKDLKGDESSTEEAVSSEVHKVEIEWSR